MNDFSQKNSVSLINNGTHFIEETVKCITQAKTFIFVHTYILKFDEVTGPIISALIEAREKGVEVFVLVDAFGSKHITEAELNIFQKNKIHFRFFKPLTHFKHLGRRLHQKLVLVDNRIAIVGGINMAKEYNLPESSEPWLDYACLLKGEEIKVIFQRVLSMYLSNFQNYNDQIISYSNLAPENSLSTCLVRTTVNDWMRYKNEIYHSYIEAIKASEKSVYLLATYFIPGKKLLKELKKARERGVEINLIFGSQSDHKIIQKVEYYFYKWYLLNDFKLYEWHDSIVHGKIALIDDRWITIGSYNHNYISRFGNLELNLEIINKEFAKFIDDEFKKIISKSTQLDKTKYSGKFSFLDKIFIISSFVFLNITTLFSLFFILRRKK